ncbi:glycosyltransferase family 4 protein [Tenacibaculum sp. S7007]|uniref:Glycosyltransferase family 4 protein n=1 Tax=Tenacibaculum pelagium TaxID=2759527 RepID=A0A839AMH9_9FLAO|nr:glycosyltransferase family 4 protein [Tenacibaculum pelagium]MBA6156293.1 glycosyltransferase family 4 protein [Tenacibaculum pelagium]
MKKKKIIFLYSEVVGYLIPIFKSLVEDYEFEVHVVFWDKNRMKPYKPVGTKGVFYYPSSNYNRKQILTFCKHISPDIVYVSGWMDKKYLHATKYLKREGVPIVTGFDDRWVNSFRQKLGAFLFPFLYKKYFSHAWVAGVEQYEFASRLGFVKEKIIFDLLSANTEVFDKNKYEEKHLKKKTFLYVGNFRKVKGTDILIEAYKIYKERFNGDWSLVCVGNGELDKILKNVKGLKLYPYSNEQELINIALKSSVFILPSRNDQWGVVVHEFAGLGLPLLLSENVGAKCTFFINKFNGLLFENNSPEELAQKMKEFSQMNYKDLKVMGENSYLLSKRISPQFSVANLMSVLK